MLFTARALIVVPSYNSEWMMTTVIRVDSYKRDEDLYLLYEFKQVLYEVNMRNS